MQLSTSAFLSTQSPLSARQIEHLIEGACFDTERQMGNRPGRMSGVDLRGLDLAYRQSPLHQHSSDSPLDNLCDICSEFPAWLDRADGRGSRTGGFCLGRLRRVLRQALDCKLCLVVAQSAELSYGPLEGSFPAGYTLWLVPRGRAMIDVKLSDGIAQHQEVADWSSWPAVWVKTSETHTKLSQRRQVAGLQLRDPIPNFQPRYLSPKFSQPNPPSRLRLHRWLDLLVRKEIYPKHLKLFDCRSYRVTPARSGTPYCALRHNLSGVFHPSHIWLNRPSGGAKKTTDSDIFQIWGFLPRPVAEAVGLTLEMGYRYLWVDSLCIDLGDDAEKEKQTKQVAKVFSTAEYVFTADIGKDAHAGLKGIYEVQGRGARPGDDRDGVVMAGAKIGEWVVRPCLSATPESLSSCKRGSGLTDDQPERADGLHWTWQSLAIQHEREVSKKALSRRIKFREGVKSKREGAYRIAQVGMLRAKASLALNRGKWPQKNRPESAKDMEDPDGSYWT